MENVVTSYEHTKNVHDALSDKLKQEEARLATLMAYERDVALQIEDTARVILAIRRSIATLKSGIPDDAPPAAEPPVPTSLREALQNVDAAERLNYFSEEEMERRHISAAMPSGLAASTKETEEDGQQP